jgi:hypothetical protein
MPTSLLRQPNFAALLVLAWLVVALALLLVHWPRTALTLLDTDDAMRLVQLRGWLGGPGLRSGWFDMHQTRMQPPFGVDILWSRLIDVGLAGLLTLFSLFAEPPDAERLMRAWWPLLWLLPTMAAMVAIAWRIAGREAAMIALLLAMVGVPAYQQFTPGRIDHHNVQLTLTFLTAAATVWSDRKRWCAFAAGALTGLAFGIGIESVPYLAACGAAFALHYVADRDAGTALRDYALGLALFTLISFGINVPPAHWTRNLCDAIAINNAAAVMCGALVLALAGSLDHPHRVTRAAAVAGALVVAVAVLLLFEPRCIHGPLGMVDPAIRPIWFDNVREMQSLLEVWRKNPLTASAIAAFPAAAAVAAVVLVRRREFRGDFGFFAAVLIFAVAAGVTVVAIRAYSYAMWLGMPLVAVLGLRLFAMLRLRSVVARALLALALTPMALSSGAITIAVAAGLNDRDDFSRPASRPCFQTANYAALRDLPRGLVAADISAGPFVLALTPHSVFAGPYHWLSSGIVTAHRAFAEPPEQAREVLRNAKADYLLVCGSRSPDGLPEPVRGRSLWAKLQAGVVPDWLEPINGDPGFAVYRVRQQP